MVTWIVLLGLLLPLSQPPNTDAGLGRDAPEPLRYRGIERLLAEFDREAHQNR